MKAMRSIIRKELDSYFSSPMALIFIGVFLAITLFKFFFIDSFFGRGIADVRPLFRSLPVLLIFLIAALTMRQWSEEQQTGTLEVLLTMPIRLIQLVMGKFLATLVLVIVTLAITLILPITVSMMGSLDWGPVIGGYLAAILMASAYIAIGLFISSRTDNQIVALIISVIVAGLFHLVGSATLTQLAGSSLAEIMRAFGTGSRFESIERGVIDLRDLLYYVTLTGVFLTLNLISLDSKRWSRGEKTRNYRFNSRLMAVLSVANLIALNFLIFPLSGARVDLTQNGEFSLSPVTRDVLNTLQEPLLIRGYFSENNHPLLEPLIPRVRDTLEEYKIASNGKLELDFVDPISDPEIEREANQTYGIRPTPLQINNRSGSSIINAYFDILIRYGDQTQILNLLDLIEIDQFGSGDFDLRLKNLEYDLTSSIQRAVLGFQSLDSVFESLTEPAKLTLYITPDSLPQGFEDVQDTITSIASDIETQSNGKFTFEAVDMSDPNTRVTPDSLVEQYQIQPIATSIFSTDSFYLHMVVTVGDKTQVIFPTGELSETEIRNNIESALKRLSSGFLPVVGVWTPPSTSAQAAQAAQSSGQPQSLQAYSTLMNALGDNYETRPVDLSTGQVPGDIDTLIVIASDTMTDMERYAIDQYLMRGGSVFIAAGNYRITSDPYTGSLMLEPVDGALQDMLTSYGITVEPSLALDTQNTPFPVQVQRNLGGILVNEVQAINYPQFVNIRPNGMDHDSPVVADVPEVTLNWASPITLDEDLNAGRTVTTLMESTDKSWTTTDTNIQPNQEAFGDIGFEVDEETQQSYPLAVAVQGQFQSYFTDKPTPFEAEAADASTDGDAGNANTTPEAEPTVNPVETLGKLETSPESARLVVFGSSEFLNDNIFRLESSLTQDRALSNLQLAQNAVSWFVEDTSLSNLRAHSSAARILDPMTDSDQSRWEILNYVLALISLGAIGVIWRLRKRGEKPMALASMDNTVYTHSTPSQPVGAHSLQGGK